MHIIPIVYRRGAVPTSLGVENEHKQVATIKCGDFSFMIHSSVCSNDLFIFNDDVESYRGTSQIGGRGNAIIRGHPNAIGVPTGSRRHGGFARLTPNTKAHIDRAMDKIQAIAPNYTRIYYSATSLDDDTIGCGIFTVGDDVRAYITRRIHQL